MNLLNKQKTLFMPRLLVPSVRVLYVMHSGRCAAPHKRVKLLTVLHMQLMSRALANECVDSSPFHTYISVYVCYMSLFMPCL